MGHKTNTKLALFLISVIIVVMIMDWEVLAFIDPMLPFWWWRLFIQFKWTNFNRE